MNLREAKGELSACTDAGNCVLMVSGSGIGKSQLVYQEFTALKEREKDHTRWGLGVIFAATQTPPDLIGYQFKGDRQFTDPVTGEIKSYTITDPSCPLWMMSVPHGDDPGGKPAWMYDRFFLHIDEYGQGEGDTKRAMAEIALNGGTSPWYLPYGSIRVMCSNEGLNYGVTKDFDFCVARRTLIRITGNAEVWVEDFADKPYAHQGKQWQVMPVTKAWALTNPQCLFEKEPKVQGPWCNPRTLTSMDRYLQVKARRHPKGEVPTDTVTQEVMEGTIGTPSTQSFMQHLTYRVKLPPYEDVVADPTGIELPKKVDMLMLMAYEMAGRAKPKDLQALMTLIGRKDWPRDMAITFISALVKRDYKAVINEPAMQAWITKNAALVSTIAALTK